ncbi:urease accessory protein [Colletotrichum chrysophilum]|uniref:Urease accessory protein n=1 Tax=Colletotrichum chrysophilum TaxID=1836956 RepID=A0AAD9AJ50_9PEZI|nr:urease accessory protein [Colletotrichum chrysophilum]
MLGWVLRRGLEGASGGNRAQAGGGDDTTQIEQPDTPAPVFAARALKSAIFGTPARDDDRDHRAAGMSRNRNVDDSETESRTPVKQPQGILLTPGTGTSRRKRVSFGHDVLDKGGLKKGKGKDTDDKPGKFPSSFDSAGDSASKRTKLTEAMENSRKGKALSSSRETQPPQQMRLQPQPVRNDDAEDEWEEADDDQCTHDMTIDLNEPHSRSGKYWKSEFEQYHQDAKAEMEKLLKYKQLAKSYAKLKDAEAIDLNVKLKEEQDRVAQMEQKIADMAAQIAAKRVSGEERDNPQLMKDLAKQTAVAVEYRTQVKELAALLEGRDDDGDPHTRRRQTASPRTQRTLMETQRELRKARSQVKENNQMKEEIEKLKSDLLFAEQRANKLAEENKRLAEQQSLPNKTKTASSAELEELEELREESRQKDEELRRIKADFDAYRKDAEAAQEDTRRILEKATDKINDLKKEVKTLKAAGTVDGHRPKTSVSSLPERETVEKERGHRNHDKNRFDVAPVPIRRTSNDTSSKRRSLEIVESLGRKLNQSKSHNLRDKYHEDAGSYSSGEEDLVQARPKSEILSGKVTLDKPRWRPFIPRSPRNRAYLGSEINERIVSSSEVPSGTTPAPRHRFASKENDPPIDLLQDRFARLGMPEADASTMAANTSKSTLPPERRAAAIARIEQRKAEKRRALAGLNKENMRP